MPKIKLIPVLLLWLVAGLFGSGAHAQLRPFTAVYAAAYKGSEIGQGTLTLDVANGRYSLDLKIEPTGLLAIIPFAIHEQAQGTLDSAGVHPSRYAYTRSGLGKKRQETVVFDPSGIQREAKGTSSTLPYDANLTDPLSLILQVTSDLQADRLQTSYRLLNRGKIKTYPIQDQGQATSKTELGELPAHHIQRGTDDQLIRFWFGSSVAFVPLKIVQFEDNREEISLSIRSLEWR